MGYWDFIRVRWLKCKFRSAMWFRRVVGEIDDWAGRVTGMTSQRPKRNSLLRTAIDKNGGCDGREGFCLSTVSCTYPGYLLRLQAINIVSFVKTRDVKVLSPRVRESAVAWR